jgi:DNA end-binding protein Ku
MFGPGAARMTTLGDPTAWLRMQSGRTCLPVNKSEDYFCDLPELTIAPGMLALAEHIVDVKAGEFDPTNFRDRYEEALLAHLKARQAGAVPERKPTFAPPHRVINLMGALRRSVAEDKKLSASPHRGSAASWRAAPCRRAPAQSHARASTAPAARAPPPLSCAWPRE